MNQHNKQQLQTNIEQYLNTHGISQNELAELSGVNAAYIINIRKGIYTVKSGDKTIDIADKWLNRLANTVGYAVEKLYWETKPTIQMRSILATLKDAKETGETAVIIGETGCGKSYVAKLFAQKNPADVYIITVGASDNLGDLLNKIMYALRIESIQRSKSAKINYIAKTLRKLSESGREPMLVFDEAEYMRQPALCALKELYDALNTWCALVLIGTNQLVNNLEKLRKKNKPGIPQLYRRIKYRIHPLPLIDRTFKDFLNGFETDLKKWLSNNCDNYGELHDVLVPALRDAERTGNKLTIETVKLAIGQ